MNIGNNIKQLRQKNNLTQEQVAGKLGVSYQAVSKWENGANTPDIALLPEIANLFGVTIDSLFSDDINEFSEALSLAKDDDIIRIVQMRGRKINCGKIVCNTISDCYRLEDKSIECSGNVNSANLTCGQITYMK